VFFGREQDGKNLETALRSTAARSAGGLLVVLGPSGCGKSSLVRAGLLHRMADDDDWLPTNAFRPGGDPLRALARELVDAARRMRLTWGPADVYERLRGEGLVAVADELLQAPSGPRRHHLLVLVDQLEELLTRTPPHKRADVARLLRPLADSPVQVVATLRSEFLDDLLTDPFLAGLPLTTHLLRPLRPEALRDVVSRPAETAGLTLDEHLLDRLVADTAGGEALPLLARAAHYAPDNARHRAYYAMALSHDHTRRHQAEGEMQAALRIDPQNATFRLMLAEFFIDLGLKKRAEGELKRLLAIFPSNREALDLLHSLKNS